jgi:hypothetical protein
MAVTKAKEKGVFENDSKRTNQVAQRCLKVDRKIARQTHALLNESDCGKKMRE